MKTDVNLVTKTKVRNRMRNLNPSVTEELTDLTKKTAIRQTMTDSQAKQLGDQI